MVQNSQQIDDIFIGEGIEIHLIETFDDFLHIGVSDASGLLIDEVVDVSIVVVQALCGKIVGVGFVQR
jgi:hypothetical protein